MPRRQWQRERQKSNTFSEQNDNSAYASHFLVNFFAVSAPLRSETSLFRVGSDDDFRFVFLPHVGTARKNLAGEGRRISGCLFTAPKRQTEILLNVRLSRIELQKLTA